MLKRHERSFVGFDWRPALALASTYYVAIALALTVHKAGHGLDSKLTGGTFKG